MNLKYKIIDNKYFNIKDVLKSHFAISDRLLTKLKHNKKIYLNGKSEYVTKEVQINDLIEVNLDFNETSNNIIPIEMNLNILYEDDSFIIIDKPSNIPIHPSIGHYENSISNGVAFYFNNKNIKTKIRPVNRLDKDTSGIVIFAKNEYIQECLIKQMKDKKFKKEYYAILEGHLKNDTGTITAPISRKLNSIIEREVNETGSNAITHYKVIERFSIEDFSTGLIQNLSFVNFYIETGRTHQIRVHSKYIGHPILGDTLYGHSSNLISRQALHAYKVSFIHPILNSLVEFESQLPDNIQKLILKK